MPRVTGAGGADGGLRAGELHAAKAVAAVHVPPADGRALEGGGQRGLVAGLRDDRQRSVRPMNAFGLPGIRSRLARFWWQEAFRHG